VVNIVPRSEPHRVCVYISYIGAGVITTVLGEICFEAAAEVDLDPCIETEVITDTLQWSGSYCAEVRTISLYAEEYRIS
jgi:hypothetical protein